MPDTIESRVKTLYDELEPDPEVRADLLASLETERRTLRTRWAMWGGLAAAAAVLTAFLIATPRDDGEPDAVVAVAGNADEERATNTEAYEKLKPTLHEKHKGKWVVIAKGALALVADTFQEVLAADVPGAHRFVFEVGTEGDLETFVSTWYAPRFAGPTLAKALEVDWSSGPNGLEIWRKGGARKKSFTKGPFPRMRLDIGAPGGRREGLELFLGTVGPPLVLTRADHERMGLARFEVPGTHKLLLVTKCDRVLVQVAIDESDTPRTVIAAVSRESDTTMIGLARSRHRFWDWGGSLSEAATAPHDRGWILFGNDRVLGAGSSPEQAVKDGEGATDFAYHRYLVRMPYEPQTVMLSFARLPSPETLRFEDTQGQVVPVTIQMRLHGEVDISVIDEPTARALGLHMREVPMQYGTTRDEKTVPVRAGYVWRVDRDGERTLQLVGVLEPRVDPIVRLDEIEVASIQWSDVSLEGAAAQLTLQTGILIEVVGAELQKRKISFSASDLTLAQVLDMITMRMQPELMWRYRAGVVIIHKGKGKR